MPDPLPPVGGTFTLTFGDQSTKQLAYNATVIADPADPSQISDGHHTFAELYEQRALYHALLLDLALSQRRELATKSWRHHDGEPCFGITEPGKRWFIVTMTLPGLPLGANQITQHYPESDWELFSCPEVTQAAEWDGHDAAEGNRRMREFLAFRPDPSRVAENELR